MSVGWREGMEVSVNGNRMQFRMVKNLGDV